MTSGPRWPTSARPNGRSPTPPRRRRGDDRPPDPSTWGPRCAPCWPTPTRSPPCGPAGSPMCPRAGGFGLAGLGADLASQRRRTRRRGRRKPAPRRQPTTCATLRVTGGVADRREEAGRADHRRRREQSPGSSGRARRPAGPSRRRWSPRRAVVDATIEALRRAEGGVDEVRRTSRRRSRRAGGPTGRRRGGPPGGRGPRPPSRSPASPPRQAGGRIPGPAARARRPPPSPRPRPAWPSSSRADPAGTGTAAVLGASSVPRRWVPPSRA